MKIACIGSRDIDEATFQKLKKIGRFIAKKGWEINSGNADGSDFAFQSGANEVDPNLVNVYMPWKTYNLQHLAPGNNVKFDVEPEWSKLARLHHPKYSVLKDSVKALMDRNAGIVMDSDRVLAFLNHDRVGAGGTRHGWNCAGGLNLLRFDVSTLTKGVLVEEVFEWLEAVAIA